MILICGIPSETPIKLLTEELDLIGANYLFWNQRKFEATSISLKLTENGKIVGNIIYEGIEYSFAKITAVYYRLTDWTTLPEIENKPGDLKLRKQCERVHLLMQLFIDHCQGEVVNRSEDMMSNNSKPYQLFLAKEAGISIPDTCITTSEEEAIDFYNDKKNEVIYKSISGTRSIVQKLAKSDLQGLKKVYFCPTQFQEFVVGNNLRVHVVNETCIATEITSEATDYRYATTNGGNSPVLSHIELPAEQQLKCIRFSKQLKLFFSGLDFKRKTDGTIICLEANPMPGYSYYEQSTSQPIAYTLACELNKIDQEIT